MHGMLLGRRAIRVEVGAEEEWEKAGTGPRVQSVAALNADVICLKFGDRWKLYTRGAGQPKQLFECLMISMMKGGWPETVHAIENRMKTTTTTTKNKV